DEDAALSLGQPVIGALFCDAQMGTRSQLQAATYHGPLHHHEHGNRAKLHLLESRVPFARVEDALAHRFLADLREVEAGAEVLALAADHGCARLRGYVDESRMDLAYEFTIDHVALGGAREAHVEHSAGGFDLQQLEIAENALRGLELECHLI